MSLAHELGHLASFRAGTYVSTLDLTVLRALGFDQWPEFYVHRDAALASHLAAP
jgi:hypothetical protein